MELVNDRGAQVSGQEPLPERSLESKPAAHDSQPLKALQKCMQENDKAILLLFVALDCLTCLEEKDHTSFSSAVLLL